MGIPQSQTLPHLFTEAFYSEVLSPSPFADEGRKHSPYNLKNLRYIRARRRLADLPPAANPSDTASLRVGVNPRR